MKIKMKNRSHRYNINRLLGLDMHTNIKSIKSVSVWCLWGIEKLNIQDMFRKTIADAKS